jgi:CheY-like chemotaxis protein
MDLGQPPAPDEPTEGLRCLQETLALFPDTKVIMLTGQNDRANAVKAIALGAYDFYTKPFEPELLSLIIERAFRLHDLQAENCRLHAAQASDALGGIITRDPEMQRVCKTVERVATTDATVLLLGESGTGKEILARDLHAKSGRRAQRFVAINCAAIRRTSSSELRLREGRVHRRGQATIGRSRRRTAARCSSTRSATCRARCRRSSCASCRSASSSAWAAGRRSRWTCGSCARPTRT